MAKTNAPLAEPFAEDPADQPPIRGFLHKPRAGNGAGLVLTHGAGGNCGSRLLVSIATRFAEAGIAVLRCDLPFRQGRQGPPHPSGAAKDKDRAGLRSATGALRRIVSGNIFLGGQSYGGRQATMLAAEDSTIADGLVLLSYPLHPPKAPEKKRTAHFPQLQVPALFFHGAQDPFGTREEMETALRLIPVKTHLVSIEAAGHSLVPAKSAGLGTDELAVRVLDEFQLFFERH
ncbi:MAG: alpha/beta family hydrolase [Bryobacterales bacterium]